MCLVLPYFSFHKPYVRGLHSIIQREHLGFSEEKVGRCSHLMLGTAGDPWERTHQLDSQGWPRGTERIPVQAGRCPEKPVILVTSTALQDWGGPWGRERGLGPGGESGKAFQWRRGYGFLGLSLGFSPQPSSLGKTQEKKAAWTHPHRQKHFGLQFCRDNHPSSAYKHVFFLFRNRRTQG